jgi:hypothetical protein
MRPSSTIRHALAALLVALPLVAGCDSYAANTGVNLESSPNGIGPGRVTGTDNAANPTGSGPAGSQSGIGVGAR